VTLFLSGMLIECPAPDAEGQGTDKVIEAFHNRPGKINGCAGKAYGNELENVRAGFAGNQSDPEKKVSLKSEFFLRLARG